MHQIKHSSYYPHNAPFRLGDGSATEMARMPTYYVMDAAEGMAETVAKHMPSTDAAAANAWLPFSGRTIDQPATFISGASDWGVYQSPGALERMRDEVCTDFRGVHLVEGAGHWVQQEQPSETVRLLVGFLREAGP